MFRNSSGYGGNFGSKNNDVIFSESSRDWTNERESITEKARPLPRATERSSSKKSEPESDIAQKKFANAKAISSDQFFDSRGDDYETKANLNRFQGSSSISSSEFFGNGKGK